MGNALGVVNKSDGRAALAATRGAIDGSRGPLIRQSEKVAGRHWQGFVSHDSDRTSKHHAGERDVAKRGPGIFLELEIRDAVDRELGLSSSALAGWCRPSTAVQAFWITTAA